MQGGVECADGCGLPGEAFGSSWGGYLGASEEGPGVSCLVAAWFSFFVFRLGYLGCCYSKEELDLDSGEPGFGQGRCTWSSSRIRRLAGTPRCSGNHPNPPPGLDGSDSFFWTSRDHKNIPKS